VKKKADPSSRLVADPGPLRLVAWNGEHKGRAFARHYPALVWRERGVLQSGEAKDIAEEGEPVVIAGNKNRDGG
jgi:hypothetical protein